MNHGSMRHILVLLASILTLTACTDSSVSSRNIDTPTYLFFGAEPSLLGTISSVYAVDPNNPASPINLETAVTDDPVFFMAGNVDASSFQIKDLHHRYLVYPVANQLFRRSAVRSEGLERVRISNENNFGNRCAILGGFEDYANPENSLFIYRTDPDDANACNNDVDDRIQFVRLSMTSTDTPLRPVFAGCCNHRPVMPVYNSAGGLTHIITASNFSGNLYLFDLSDPNLQTFTTLLAGTTSARLYAINPHGQGIISETTGATTTVRSFDPVSLTLSATLHTVSGSLPYWMMSDETYAYFTDNKILYRVPFDGSVPASIVADESASTGSFSAGTSAFRISRDRIVYVFNETAGSPGVHIKSVPKSGGTAAIIYSFTPGSSIYAFRAAAGRVYVTESTTSSALSIGDAGESPVLYPASLWAGFTYHSTQRLYADMEPAGKLKPDAAGEGSMSFLAPKTIFRADYNGSTANPASLISYDADTTAQLVNFGVPTYDFRNFITYPPVPLGVTTSERTLFVFNRAGGSYADILYLHARNSGTMVRVTNSNQYRTLIGVRGCSTGSGSGRNGIDPTLPILLLLSMVYMWRQHRKKSVG